MEIIQRKNHLTATGRNEIKVLRNGMNRAWNHLDELRF